ncbi:glycosyltransferase [Microbacterium allomyrinae]|uniref:Glycosyltransferase n=1 Tax=Microbacterium allomyrinae TaxID=2830666 RepID=A0A9X1S4H6_9MICO|nr:glycosyltransferase [Microbacterium allomyrinae]MCC2033015.1 glycosyltransferase [Microbacterium allomyrinae]
MMRIGTLPPRPAVPATVLVVVPCYNYGRYLRACADSILSQEGVAVEMLIMDDASTDDSAAIAAEIAAADPRVRVVSHPVNRGHIQTYNEALPTATSDYVVLLSADDLLAPGALDRATRIMAADRRIGLVYGHPQEFSTAPVTRTVRFASRTAWRGSRWIDHQFDRGLSIIHSPEAVVRTSVHRQAGWYRPELPHSGDLELWLRIAAVADVARVNGPDQAYRRVHDESMMRTRFSGALRDLVERRRAYESFLDGAALSPRRTARLRRLMNRRLAAEAFGWACAMTEELQPGLADVVGADAADVVAFGESIYPGFRGLAAWRELDARSRGPAMTRVDRAGARAGAALRELSGRLRWRRWRYLGY